MKSSMNLEKKKKKAISWMHGLFFVNRRISQVQHFVKNKICHNLLILSWKQTEGKRVFILSAFFSFVLSQLNLLFLGSAKKACLIQYSIKEEILYLSSSHKKCNLFLPPSQPQLVFKLRKRQK